MHLITWSKCVRDNIRLVVKFFGDCRVLFEDIYFRKILKTKCKTENFLDKNSFSFDMKLSWQ